MLKFVKHTMETIAGVEIFPIISFLIFFTFFIGLLYWIIKVDKKYISRAANIPLED
jgi:cbb3-type cytochrome oxidase subunit 3